MYNGNRKSVASTSISSSAKCNSRRRLASRKARKHGLCMANTVLRSVTFLRKPNAESLIVLSLRLESGRNLLAKNSTTFKSNQAKLKKPKRKRTHKYLLQHRQCGIGGQGGAQCGHVADLVIANTRIGLSL